jgi:hypothetical protein
VTLDTYESVVASGRYLTVPAGRDPDRVKLPRDREWAHLKLVRGGYLLHERVAQSDLGARIRSEIEARGYAIHEVDLGALGAPGA